MLNAMKFIVECLLSDCYQLIIELPLTVLFPAPDWHLVCIVIQLLYLHVYQNLCWGRKSLIVAAMGAEKFLPFHCKDTTPSHTCLFSGFTNETNSPGSLSSRFYHLSKDHLQHLHTSQWKGWENMATCGVKQRIDDRPLLTVPV